MKYVIVFEGPLADPSEPKLYWNYREGWGSRMRATTYTEFDRGALPPPGGGAWEPMILAKGLTPEALEEAEQLYEDLTYTPDLGLGIYCPRGFLVYPEERDGKETGRWVAANCMYTVEADKEAAAVRALADRVRQDVAEHGDGHCGEVL